MWSLLYYDYDLLRRSNAIWTSTVFVPGVFTLILSTDLLRSSTISEKTSNTFGNDGSTVDTKRA